jgi:hypothetical protein
VVKADLGCTGEGGPNPKGAKVDRPLVNSRPNCRKRRGRMHFDLGDGDVRAKAEYPRVPQAAFSDQPRSSCGIRLLDKTRDRGPFLVDRLSFRDVPERRGRPGRVHPQHDDPPVPREPGCLGDRDMKCLNVGNEMVGRDHQDDRPRIAPRGQAGGQRDRGEGVPRLRLKRDRKFQPEVQRLVGDQEPRLRGRNHDWFGEELAGQPGERALEW